MLNWWPSKGTLQFAIRMFQRDAEMKNIVLADATARDQAIRHFFGRALREAREDPGLPTSAFAFSDQYARAKTKSSTSVRSNPP